ncbi:MAG TPA: MlaD family protein [Gemmatimonadales bacterium]|nr:MlaD family protein [Gemmatimonadales bacterium]
METNRQDFLVGLLILAAIGVVIGALIATSGWGERRYDLYMRAASAQGLTVDTKVLVQGLQVGRVTSILPRVDPATRSVSFLARLSLAERFDKGTQLRLPVGTRAEVDQVSQISAEAVIHLVMPDSTHRTAVMLQAGDTINSTRLPSPLDALANVANHLSKEVEDVLHQTRTALATVQRTVGAMDETMRHVTPDVEATLHSVAASTNRLTNLLARTDQAGFPDSLSSTLATTHRLLGRLDSLTASVQDITNANRDNLRETVTNLTQMSRQLNHFVDEMSARPYRLFTGVKKLPADTARKPADSTRAAIKP